MSVDALYTVELTEEELTLIRVAVRKREWESRDAILAYRKHPHLSKDEILRDWYRKDVEDTITIMVLLDKLVFAE